MGASTSSRAWGWGGRRRSAARGLVGSTCWHGCRITFCRGWGSARKGAAEYDWAAFVAEVLMPSVIEVLFRESGGKVRPFFFGIEAMSRE